MPFVELIDCPYIGRKGQVVNLTDAEARVVIALGQAKVFVPMPKAEPRRRTRTTKKRYQRKDIHEAPERVVEEPEQESSEHTIEIVNQTPIEVPDSEDSTA